MLVLQFPQCYIRWHLSWEQTENGFVNMNIKHISVKRNDVYDLSGKGMMIIFDTKVL